MSFVVEMWFTMSIKTCQICDLVIADTQHQQHQQDVYTDAAAGLIKQNELQNQSIKNKTYVLIIIGHY